MHPRYNSLALLTPTIVVSGDRLQSKDLRPLHIALRPVVTSKMLGAAPLTPLTEPYQLLLHQAGWQPTCNVEMDFGCYCIPSRYPMVGIHLPSRDPGGR